MNFSDAIDAKGRVNRHVGHVNLTIFNDLHRIPFGFANSFLIEIQIKAAVNFLNNHINAGNQMLHVLDRPFF